jgi:hypothetical protein
MKIRHVITAVMLGMSLNCAGEKDSTSISPTEVNSASEALELTSNTANLVSGSFSEGDNSITFLFERNGDQHLMSILTPSGRLLLQATLAPDVERVDLGDTVSFEGPSGSLFRKAGPRWDLVRIEGDPTSATSVQQTPEFQLIGELAAALANRSDVDASVLPSMTGFESVDAEQISEDGTPARPGLHPLAANPVECGFCHAGCVAATAACVVATWGVFAWLCAAPGVACHAACGHTGACQ